MSILLYIHIILGIIGLIAGILIILLKKGDKRHQQIGKIFSYALGISMLGSFPISIYKENTFLFCIGIWTLYMIITGNRSLKITNTKMVSKIDWLITILMLLFGFLLLENGLSSLHTGLGLPIVSAVFAWISFVFVWTDIRFFNGKMKAINAHKLIHIQRMMGAFIASVTAFIVVNNTILPGLVAWLLPTLVFTPLIIRWSRKIEIKGTQGS
jgi:uncharacterized membrane protein